MTQENIKVYKCNGVPWFIREGHDIEEVGFVPMFLDINDERPAAEQIDANYQHGGGWNPMEKWTFDRKTKMIKYPGDEPLESFAVALPNKNETVIMYPHSFMLIYNKVNKTYEVGRVD